ncbi:hypothetical protein JTB14_020214 [Gonioctena quinquepunctata]|nr:hypothetical protein JTB14_020214 [Gonioctena quinquepunctata]
MLESKRSSLTNLMQSPGGILGNKFSTLKETNIEFSGIITSEILSVESLEFFKEKGLLKSDISLIKLFSQAASLTLSLLIPFVIYSTLRNGLFPDIFYD